MQRNSTFISAKNQTFHPNSKLLFFPSVISMAANLIFHQETNINVMRKKLIRFGA